MQIPRLIAPSVSWFSGEISYIGGAGSVFFGNNTLFGNRSFGGWLLQ